MSPASGVNKQKLLVALSIAGTVLALAYPAFVYFGLKHWEPRVISFVLAAVFLLRLLFTASKKDFSVLLISSVAIACSLAALLSNERLYILLTPVAINATLFFVFASSLLQPPTVIEKIARLREPELDQQGVRYTNKLTVVWCVFFVANGGAALYTALFSSYAIWAIYNGIIGYALMATLLLGELLLREAPASIVTMNSLRDLLLSDRDPQSIVALDSNGECRWQQFYRETTGLTSQLADCSEKRWLLHSDDSYLFAVRLIALIASEKTAILAPNAQPGTLQEWKTHCDTIWSDDSCTIGQRRAESALSVTESTLPLTADGGGIALATSGSTGKPVLIEKNLAALDAELHCQQQLWLTQDKPCTFFSTVSHQHIYGLLFRILLPLTTGNAFWRATHQYPEELFNDIAQHRERAMLVTSPTHLNRLPPELVYHDAAENIERIFSSGGPLPLSSAIDTFNKLEQRPVEILGSTETGGVAFRQQSGENTPWQTFPRVEIRTQPGNAETQPLLCVKSPFIGSDEWFSMGDVIEPIDEHRFHLKGRADRIVKFEGKRLSITQMENTLNAISAIHEARVVLLEEPRPCVAAVIALHESGHRLLAEHGKLAFNERIKSELKKYFDLVLLPKRWRYVEALPVNSQGKVTQQHLQSLFAQQQDAAKHTPPVSPPASTIEASTLFDINEHDHTIDIKINLRENHWVFEGHFIEIPVLAGVRQIDWAIALSKKWYAPTRFASLKDIKFHKVITDKENIDLQLHDLGDGVVQFSYRCAGQVASSGKILFDQP